MSYYITHSGRKIVVEDLSEKDIHLSDIAHHLSKICRYGGALALDRHYSVAQHSLQLSNYAREQGLDVEVQRALLMHDATEAYLGDVVSGLKKHLPDYTAIESKLADIIYLKYNILQDKYIQRIVREFDTRILLDEAAVFVPHHYEHFQIQLGDLEPLGVNLFEEKDLRSSYYLFLYFCRKLGIKDE